MSTTLVSPAGSVAPADSSGVTRSPAKSAIWERLSLAALLVGTTVAYLWNLSINGWANSFYSAAIQAGSQSWKAWFFGSSDMAKNRLPRCGFRGSAPGSSGSTRGRSWCPRR